MDETIASHGYLKITMNEYSRGTKPSKKEIEAQNHQCMCVFNYDDVKSACGSKRCWNMSMHHECGQDCPTKERCLNSNFRKNRDASELENTLTLQFYGKKGYGAKAARDIKPGEFIVEYVGEVISQYECARRARANYLGKKKFYLMSIGEQLFIDSSKKGNIGRFINHSCKPNSAAKKWCVEGKRCIGIFAAALIKEGDEITYDYQFDSYGDEKQICLCGHEDVCRGYLTQKSIARKNELVVPPKLSIVPKTERIVPRNERIVPRNERIVPKIERIVPKIERIVPRTGRIVPRTGRIVPKTALMFPTTGLIVPKIESIVPKNELIVPRNGLIIPPKLYRSKKKTHIIPGVINRSPKKKRLAEMREPTKMRVCDSEESSSDEEVYECPVCDKPFRYLGRLKKHRLEYCGVKSTKYECGICGKLFMYPSGLKRHQVVHSDAKAVKCEICQKTFSCPEYLKKHQIVHNRGNFRCEICGKVFARAYGVKQHLLVHTRVKQFKCQCCGKAFGTASIRSRHERLICLM